MNPITVFQTMKKYIWVLRLILTTVLVVLTIIAIPGRTPVNASTSPCMAILVGAATKSGVKGIALNTADNILGDGVYDCMVQYVVSSESGSDATKPLLSLASSAPTIEKSCTYPQYDQFTPITSHGYYGRTSYRKGATRIVNDVPYTYETKDLGWCMYKGGRAHHLIVSTDTQSIEKYGPAQDSEPIANALWAEAEDNLPFTGGMITDSNQPPETDALNEDQSIPSGDGVLFGVPLSIVFLSLGIPIAGAISGATISAVVSALSSASTVTGVAYQKMVFKSKFDQIIQQKIKDGYYIKNPDFATNPDSPEYFPKGKEGKDALVAWATGSPDKGGRCGDATEWGKQWLTQVAIETFGQSTFVDKIDVTREGFFENWDINHRSLKLILPNGERLVPDVHESLIAGKAVVYEEKDWVKKYQDLIGSNKGDTIVERSVVEDDLINRFQFLGQDKGIKRLKSSREYLKNPTLYDQLINSYTKFPVADHIPEPKEPLPVADLKGLEGKSSVGGKR